VFLTGCFLTPEASFQTDRIQVNPGESATIGIQLNEPAPERFSVQLAASESGAPILLIPEKIRIPSGDTEAVFEVTTLESAQGGERVEIDIVESDAYTLGSPSKILVEIMAAPLPQLSLVGPDLIVDPGEGFTYSLQRTECGKPVTAALVSTGSTGCFETPSTVTLSEGVCTRSFSGTAASETRCAGRFVDVTLLATSGYVLGAENTARVTIRPLEAPAELPTATLVGLDRSLEAGQSTTLAVQLDRLATQDIAVQLLVTGALDAFIVPTEIVIPADSASRLFQVTAGEVALAGAEIQISLNAGVGYTGTLGALQFTVLP
jgi:hypothetical protein